MTRITTSLILRKMRYNSRTSRLELSPIEERNILRINGDEFFLENLDWKSPKGGNSSVFRAQHPDGDEAYIVKFFRHLRESELPQHQRRLQRFEREIEALTRVATSPLSGCAIPLVDNGVFALAHGTERRTLRYYVMQEADSDLATYLEKTDFLNM